MKSFRCMNEIFSEIWQKIFGTVIKNAFYKSGRTLLEVFVKKSIISFLSFVFQEKNFGKIVKTALYAFRGSFDEKKFLWKNAFLWNLSDSERKLSVFCRNFFQSVRDTAFYVSKKHHRENSFFIVVALAFWAKNFQKFDRKSPSVLSKLDSTSPLEHC